MKYLISTIFLLSIVFTAVADTILEGSFPQNSNRHYHIYVKELTFGSRATASIDSDIQADTDNKFKVCLPLVEPGFYNISIIIDFEDGNKSNYNTTVYLVPNKKTKINFTEEGQHYIKPIYEKIKDKNNQTLLEVQTRFAQLNRDLFDDPFDPVLTKTKLVDFYTLSDSLISVRKLTPTVQKYIQFLSFDNYNASMYRFGMDLRNFKDIDTKAYYTQDRDPISFFNDTLILGFYTGLSNIINYLDLATDLNPYSRRKSIDKISEQYDKLSYIINDTTVKNQVLVHLLESYVTQYREGEDFDTDLKSYISLARKITNSNLQQHCIQAFENLRFTLAGSPWVDLVFRDVEGKSIRLDQFKGKYVFIDIWASWCIPCIQMIPHLQALEEKYKDQNIEFIALSIDSDHKKWINKVNQLHLKGNQLWDPQREFSKLMNVSGIPHYLLYDTEGKLIAYKAEAPNSEKLKEKLDRLLKENNINN